MDLVGGYYDAGDNVKYGLPMAFTISTLSLSALYYHQDLKSAGELQNVMDAIRWGTDYFLKTSSKKNKLYVQVRPCNVPRFFIIILSYLHDVKDSYTRI